MTTKPPSDKRSAADSMFFSTSDKRTLYFADGLTFKKLDGTTEVSLDGGLIVEALAEGGKQQYIVPMDGTFMSEVTASEPEPLIVGYFTRYSRIKDKLKPDQLEVPGKGPQSKKTAAPAP